MAHPISVQVRWDKGFDDAATVDQVAALHEDLKVCLASTCLLLALVCAALIWGMQLAAFSHPCAVHVLFVTPQRTNRTLGNVGRGNGTGGGGGGEDKRPPQKKQRTVPQVLGGKLPSAYTAEVRGASARGTLAPCLARACSGCAGNVNLCLPVLRAQPSYAIAATWIRHRARPFRRGGGRRAHLTPAARVLHDGSRAWRSKC